MNLKEIESLIKFVQNSGVSEVSLEQKDFRLTIKTSHASFASAPVHQVVHVPQSAAAPAPAQSVAPAAAPATPAPAKDSAKDESKYVTIKSPMIGTFYRASNPEKPPMVNVGDDIKPGKVLCIIEAMKLFNEIESEVSGKIVKVLVDNASPVEYDQPLFLVDPS
ncbi:MAG: acetyl-CoA carboxylase biotin carboxyl carrier protein [Bacteroidetes bacterium]|nr:MAG: acetyl-CoA carboxylase biotin carboxyl carrier protein [Bacteroidota bacterium]REK00803.1 MAG: acetyl-CoA carboxylase biotin carboxyl carrier protein [Bacteroidota bacterium]REK35298.1 MAG: acetyl-CoA carboxylase biotin carboxyl carrier protein [Bacteroidota bacterium]REK48378.1 MAG: acetyl-CoA carboxylase biotin carboxyl carrier protein [Bacteroidota bacterium]